MEPIEEIIENLESGISSVAARGLMASIADGEKSKAMRIMKGEGFVGESAERIYEHFRKISAGTDLDFVEIPKEQFVVVITDAINKAKSKDNVPRFVVRKGSKVFTSQPSFENGDIHFFHNYDMIPLPKISQIWSMNPRVK